VAAASHDVTTLQPAENRRNAMNTFNDSLLIVSAPPEILFGLAIFFCIAGVTLFALSVADGNYPRVRRWIRRAGIHCRRLRVACRRGWIAPDACGAVGGGN
jgi:hypothetical protein